MTGPQTEWLINLTQVFLSVLEAETSEIKGAADSVSGENSLPGSPVAGF